MSSQRRLFSSRLSHTHWRLGRSGRRWLSGRSNLPEELPFIPVGVEFSCHGNLSLPLGGARANESDPPRYSRRTAEVSHEGHIMVITRLAFITNQALLDSLLARTPSTGLQSDDLAI